MSIDQRSQRYAEAADAFNEHEGRQDGMRVVSDLVSGFRTLAELFFTRISDDVQQRFGADSMIVPASLAKSQRAALHETDLYFIAESALCARQYEYLKTDDDWYLKWLAKARLAEKANTPQVAARLTTYMQKSAEDRRRGFASLLERTFNSAARAPLVLYQLLPPGVVICTAEAFSDATTAAAARSEQQRLLPVIADCRVCKGDVLEVGEQCRECGNPLWNYKWLTAD